MNQIFRLHRSTLSIPALEHPHAGPARKRVTRRQPSARGSTSPAAGHYRTARTILFLLLSLGLSVIGVQSSSGDPSTFSGTGSLATARYAHTATLLSSGKVLVAGGVDATNTPIASAELYNPATGDWSATGSATAFFTTATLLLNGKVLVVGGGSGSAQLYDPTTGSWSATGSLTPSRVKHTATLLPSGKVLVAGGFDTNGNDIALAELYDPATGSWHITGGLATARDGHTATLLPSGKVLVAGGGIDAPGGQALASAELYDPATGDWSETGNLATSRGGHTATLLQSGQVLVAGGGNRNFLATAELYDPTTESWSTTGSLAAERVFHTATILPSGKVLVVGGFGYSPEGYFAHAELYDPRMGSWSAAGDLATGRSLTTATVLPNGKVLVAAGFRNVALASAELYDSPSSSAGAQLQNISTRLNVLTGDKVLIGGFIIGGTDLKRVLIRGMGPSLQGVGVTLSDPTLELHQGSTTLATNDNWKINDQTGQSQQAEIEATTIPPANDLESAILATLSPGTYTAILAGKNGGTGVGLVEVYDLGQGANSKLANISTRGFVDTGDNVMIGGFIVGGGSGGGTANVIVRALGPSVPVTGALADPTLELHDGSGTTIATNDNWKTRPDGSSQQAEIEATGIPPTNDLESALVRTLPPGNYTAIVRGTNNTTGVGLVEAYNLQ
jgi:hypothetical protein